MAINYFAPRQLSAVEYGGMPDIGEAIRSGFKTAQGSMETAYKPHQLAAELLKSQLSNKTSQQNIEMNPLRKQLLEAQIARQNQLVNDPFGGHIPPGAIGQSVWLDKIAKYYGKNSNEYHGAEEAFNTEKNYKETTRKRNETLTNSMSFRLLPTNEKSRVVATAIGMGYDPTEAAQMLSNGATLEGLAQEKGVALKDVRPVYPLSGETVKQTQNRSAFAAEIGNLEKNISAPVEKYGRKFFSYSPSQIIDAIKDKDPEEQGKFLAARALQPELAALRLKAAGGTVGIEAIREMQHASLAGSKVFEGAVSPKARAAMNKYISKWIDEAVNTYTGTIQSGARLGQGAQTFANNEEQEKPLGEVNEPDISAGKVVTRNHGGKQQVLIHGEWYEVGE